MANRFTDPDKWTKNAWFCGLPPTYKLFWNYICDNCNIAGIWDVNWPLVKFHIWNEEPLDIAIFGDRIEILDNGKKWFIKGFIEFQQKIDSLEELNPKNNAHLGIIRILKKEGLTSPKAGANDTIPSPTGKGNGKGRVKVKEDRVVGEETKVEVLPLAPKEPNQYFGFIETFASIYQEHTGNPFHKQQKHFALVKKLIDTHGIEAVRTKTAILAFMCTKCASWFTQNGFADFTIEHLSSQWNSILPQVKKSDQEISNTKVLEELKKRREKDEHFSKV